MNYWVARDKRGCLKLFKDKPVFDEENKTWKCNDFFQHIMYLDDKDFPMLKCEDGPMKVAIVSKAYLESKENEIRPFKKYMLD